MVMIKLVILIFMLVVPWSVFPLSVFFNVKQCINTSNHNNGHTFDLVLLSGVSLYSIVVLCSNNLCNGKKCGFWVNLCFASMLHILFCRTFHCGGHELTLESVLYLNFWFPLKNNWLPRYLLTTDPVQTRCKGCVVSSFFVIHSADCCTLYDCDLVCTKNKRHQK